MPDNNRVSEAFLVRGEHPIMAEEGFDPDQFYQETPPRDETIRYLRETLILWHESMQLMRDVVEAARHRGQRHGSICACDVEIRKAIEVFDRAVTDG